MLILLKIMYFENKCRTLEQNRQRWHQNCTEQRKKQNQQSRRPCPCGTSKTELTSHLPAMIASVRPPPAQSTQDKWAWRWDFKTEGLIPLPRELRYSLSFFSHSVFMSCLTMWCLVHVWLLINFPNVNINQLWVKHIIFWRITEVKLRTVEYKEMQYITVHPQ